MREQAAETAKATYEAEEAKSSKLKTEYLQYQQQMLAHLYILTYVHILF